MVTVEIDGWRETHASLSETFKGATYTVNRCCIVIAYENGVALASKIFIGECCNALAHNWACGWFRFDETPHIGQVNWMPMLV